MEPVAIARIEADREPHELGNAFLRGNGGHRRIARPSAGSLAAPPAEAANPFAQLAILSGPGNARASLSDRQDGTDFLTFEFSHDQRERLHGALVRAARRVESASCRRITSPACTLVVGAARDPRRRRERRQSLPQRDHSSGRRPVPGPRTDLRRCRGRTAVGARPPPRPRRLSTTAAPRSTSFCTAFCDIAGWGRCV